MAFRLEASELVSHGMRRLLLEEIFNIQAQLTNPAIERDMGVHEARKGCKRVRAVLRLVRDEIGEILFKQENIRFRDMGRKLAAARDSWVKIEVLDTLTDSFADDPLDGRFDVFRERLYLDYQMTLRREKEDEGLIPGILAALQTATHQVEMLPIQREGFSALEGGLGRTYRRGRRGMERAISNPSPENFHEWRKRVKYLWHQVEILTEMNPEEMINQGEKLHRLADILGDHHDLVVLQETALKYKDVFVNETELKVLAGWIDERRLELEYQAKFLGEQLYYQTAEDYVNGIKEYWLAWRKLDGFA